MKFKILNIVEKFVVINLVIILTDSVSYLLSPFQDYYAEFSISSRQQQLLFNIKRSFNRSQVEQFEKGREKANDANFISWIKGDRSTLILLASAKGVAGIGKASGGDGTGGSDKVGQQVPAEVYNALSYAGTAFLFTLSAPLILYGLNKLCNKVEDCFGCGPSSKETKKMALGAVKLQNNPPEKQLQTQNESRQQQQELQSEEHRKNLQQQLQQPHQKLQSDFQAQLPISNHTGKILINQLYNHQQQLQQLQQQKKNIHATPPNSTSITLPFDLELDCKTSQEQSNFHQPLFIISAPNI